MWAVYTIIGYFVLALLIPAAWALGGAWRRAQRPRNVTCPANDAPAVLALDAWYAVRMHARGDDEVRIGNCSRWPGQKGCRESCLHQVRPPS